ncbi:MAG: hypothetical protein IT339_00860 [Thermomicrobiales bacterium]|nr:hypothetical protein [Thermomicrobiales bacterium]
MSAGRDITPAPAENAPADDANTPTTGLSSRAGAPVGATIERARQPVYGQGIVVSLIAAAFLLILAILAVRERQTVTGIPATETTGPLFWGLAVLFTVLIAIGAQFSEISAGRSAAALGHPRRKRDYPTAWIIPTAGMFAAIMLVATLHSTAMFVAGPVIAFFAVGGSLLARDLLDDATDSTLRTAATVHTIVIHVVAFLGLSAVYLNKMSLWAAVPLVAIFSFFLILENLERGNAPMQQRAFYAFLGTIVMAVVMVFLNWWLAYGWVGGGVLLVAFYAIAGVLLVQTQHGTVRRRDLVEFLAVSAIVLAISIVAM